MGSVFPGAFRRRNTLSRPVFGHGVSGPPRTDLILWWDSGVSKVGDHDGPEQLLQSGLFAAGDYLTGDLTGVSVTSFDGTGSATVTDGELIASGSVYNILLDNDSFYPHPTYISATSAVWLDVSGNGRTLTLTNDTSVDAASHCVESMTVGSNWLNDSGWTVADGSQYYPPGYIAIPHGVVIPALADGDGCSAVLYVAPDEVAVIPLLSATFDGGRLDDNFNSYGPNTPVIDPDGWLHSYGTYTQQARYSDQIDNLSGWSRSRSTVSANATEAPNGEMSADKLQASADADRTHYLTQSIDKENFSDLAFASVSIYAKKGELDWLILEPRNKAGKAYTSNFNLDEGRLGVAYPKSTIEPMGGGWYRCTVPFEIGTGTLDVRVRVYLAQGDANNVLTGTQTGAGVYLWGLNFTQTPSRLPYTTSTSADINVPANNGSSSGGCYANVVPPSSGQIKLRWKPKFNADRVSGIINILTASDSPGSLLYYDADNYLLKASDGINTAAVDCVAGDGVEYEITIVWGSGLMSLNIETISIGTLVQPAEITYVDVLPNADTDTSGVAYHPDDGTIYIIDNQTKNVHEYSVAGAWVRTIALTGFGDPEDIVWVSGDIFAILDEEGGDITEMEFGDSPDTDKSSGTTISTSLVSAEGIAWDSEAEIYYVAVEGTETAGTSDTRVVSVTRTGVVTELFNSSAAGFEGIRDFSGIDYNSNDSTFHIVSQASKKVIRCSKIGAVSSIMQTPAGPPEGIRITPDGTTMFIVGEAAHYSRCRVPNEGMECNSGSVPFAGFDVSSGKLKVAYGATQWQMLKSITIS